MGLRYDQAGVDISAGNAWVEMVRSVLAASGAADTIGGFAGLYPLDDHRSLAACCDGVGTKLELARAFDRFGGLGQDLLAMNVNDLVTCGATPLFFLDYLACGALEPERFRPFMEGLAAACASCRCALLGGETAEMPGVYPPGGFDLAGFAVGMVEQSDLRPGDRSCRPGDGLIGLPSSGVHSNGYSLVRKAVEEAGLDPAAHHETLGEPLIDALLRPTRLYVNQALAALPHTTAMAHITGGGLEENIARAAGGLRPAIDYGAWERPPVFTLLSHCGIDEEEMRSVFNLGIGFVFVAAPGERKALLHRLTEMGESPVEIGRLTEGDDRHHTG